MATITKLNDKELEETETFKRVISKEELELEKTMIEEELRQAQERLLKVNTTLKLFG